MLAPASRPIETALEPVAPVPVCVAKPMPTAPVPVALAFEPTAVE